MSNNIEERVKQIIGNQLKRPPEGISNDADFLSLGADSLDTVELVMAFEDEFEVSIPDDVAAQLKNVQEVIEYLKANTSKS